MARNKWISSAKFRKLEINDKVVIRFMIGNAYVAGKPVINLIDPKADNAENIDIRFSSGPWKGKTLNLSRQQISINKYSFPPRIDYIKR